MNAFDIADAMLLAAIHSLQELRKASDTLRAKHDAGETISNFDVLAELDAVRSISDEIRARVAAAQG